MSAELPEIVMLVIVLMTLLYQ